MFDRDVENVRLIKCWAENVGDEHYIGLAYEYETDDGAYELHIPRINAARVFGDRKLPRMEMSDIGCIMDVHSEKVLLNRGNLVMKDLDGKVHDCRGVYSAVRTISEKKPVEMTLEEIEKKLGHKVSIVSKGGEK